jgi:transposase
MPFLAALRCDRNDAPFVLNQPVNGQSVADYVEQFLMPTLSPNDIVIIDNLSSHKWPAIRKTIRSAGARLATSWSVSPTPATSNARAVCALRARRRWSDDALTGKGMAAGGGGDDFAL